jgi:hypothetical protein
MRAVKRKTAEIVFNVFGEDLVTLASSKRFNRAWDDSFDKAAEDMGLREDNFKVLLSTQRAMKRHYYRTFSPILNQIDAENFIIAIAVELQYPGVKYESDFIIDYGYAVFKNWVQKINKNSFMQRKIEIHGREIPNTNADVNFNELKKVLENKDQLLKRYFSSYELQNSDCKVRVWLPKPGESWIEKNKEHSVVLDINLTEGVELGFFRTGFDYTSLITEEQKNLKCAYIGNKKSREIGCFDSYSPAAYANETFWAR